jgi:hypothetical protein
VTLDEILCRARGLIRIRYRSKGPVWGESSKAFQILLFTSDPNNLETKVRGMTEHGEKADGEKK